jgi:hypothetical protein
MIYPIWHNLQTQKLVKKSLKNSESLEKQGHGPKTKLAKISLKTHLKMTLTLFVI